MMEEPTADEIAAVLRDVSRGVTTLVDLEAAKVEWEREYCGNVVFRLSNGWSLVVFKDCGDWDYFDSVDGPWGSTDLFDAMTRYEPDVPYDESKWWRLINWEPPDEWGMR